MDLHRTSVAALILLLTFAWEALATQIPRFAYVANNRDDTVSIFALHKSGMRAMGYVYTGAGSNPQAVAVTPSQSFLYVALGQVGIAGYAINPIDGSLTSVPGSPFLTGVEFGVCVHPSGKFLIAVSGSSVAVYAINPSTGALTSIQNVNGNTPISAAIHPSGSFLFTANGNSNSVSAFTIDQTNGNLAPVSGSPFPTGANPQSIVIEPHGKFLYVPNANGASLSAYAINQTTGVLTPLPSSPFATGSIPVAVAIRKSDLFVANSADKTISQFTIDPTTGSLTQIAAPFPTGASGPLALTANPAEPLIYVADHDSDEVLVLGITVRHPTLFYESIIRSRGAALSIALASGPKQVTYSPKFVYECNSTTNDIWGYQVTPVTGSLTRLGASPFAAGTSPQSVVSDPRGRFAFTANAGSNDVSAFVIDSQSGTLVSATGSPLAAGMQPSAVAVDNGARYVYVANSGSNSISGYSVSAAGALTPVPASPFVTGTGPRALIIDPRGKFVYVANAQANTISVFEIDAGTGTLQNIETIGAGTLPVAVAVNRDGKYVYALNQTSENISAYAIDAVTGELQPIPGSPYGGSGTSFSMIIDPVGKLVYAGGMSTIAGYKLLDYKGNLRPLQSPFSGVFAAYGMSIDLSDTFLFVANNASNSISGFQIDISNGGLQPLGGSPYPTGTNPTSVAAVSSFQ